MQGPPPREGCHHRWAWLKEEGLQGRVVEQAGLQQQVLTHTHPQG